MRYLRSYQYVFDHKDWLMHVLMVTIGLLIPILGPIVLLGYSFELIEWLLANPERKDYPKFDFNRFSENLKRGVWPFVTQLIVSFIISLPVGLLAFVFSMIIALIAKDAPILVLLAQLVMVIFSLALGILISIVMTPALLHTGFTQKLDFKALLAFSKDFVRKMWKETALAMAFLVVTASVLSVIGLCFACVGAYFASAIAYLAKDHLFCQLYVLYLQRGGTPVHTPLRSPPDDSVLREAPAAPPGPPDERIRPA